MRIFQALGMADRQQDMLEDVPVQMVLADGSCLISTRPDRPHGWAVSNFFTNRLLETALAEGLERHSSVTVPVRPLGGALFEQDGEGVDVVHVASAGTGCGRTDPAAAGRRRPCSACGRATSSGADGGRSCVRTQPRHHDEGRLLAPGWWSTSRPKRRTGCVACSPISRSFAIPVPNGELRYNPGAPSASSSCSNPASRGGWKRLRRSGVISPGTWTSIASTCCATWSTPSMRWWPSAGTISAYC